MLKGFPCRVTEYSTAKPGKHGASKATIVGVDIFTNKKYEDTYPTSATMRVPIVTKIEYEVADIDDDSHFVSYIQEDGTINSTIKMPVDDEETFKDLQKIWDERADKAIYFSLQSACGQQKFIAGRSKE